MKKLKPFNGRRKCPDGEVYHFKKGIAVVPGMWLTDCWGRIPMLITFAEFIKETRNGKIKNKNGRHNTDHD